MCLQTKEIRGNVVPCGVCAACRERKRWIYTARIVSEMFVADRSWFVTLTLRKRMNDKTGYKVVQRWLKRCRKVWRGKVRYACVAEHGGSKTHRLHYHVVLHGGWWLTQRSIRSQWRGGISEATLIRSGRAGNAARYSSKAARYTAKGNRFRFSQGYGSQAVNKVVTNETVQAVLAAFPDARLRLDGVNVPAKLQPVRVFRSSFTQEQHDDWLQAKRDDYGGKERRPRVAPWRDPGPLLL